RLTTPRHHVGLCHHSPTPQGAAVVAVPSFDRHHDGGLVADNPYSTPNQVNQPSTYLFHFTIDVTSMHGIIGEKNKVCGGFYKLHRDGGSQSVTYSPPRRRQDGKAVAVVVVPAVVRKRGGGEG
nr:hypothetical protein [Tanacetum cinerariifolium]